MKFLALSLLCITSHAYPCFDIKGDAPTQFELELITNNINHFKEWNKASIEKLMTMDFFKKPDKTDESTALIKKIMYNATNIALWIDDEKDRNVFIEQVNTLYKTHRRQLPRELVQDLKGLRTVLRYYIENVLMSNES